MEHRDRNQWLAAAVSSIRFKPDRAAVERELRDHLEDKIADLRRIFPGMSEEEAQEHALARMGDPEEIGRELARIHRPWLGYLWVASKWVLGLLIAAFLLYYVTQVETSWDNHIWGGMPGGDYIDPVGLEPEKARLGGYTFRIMEAVYVDHPEDSSYEDEIQVTVRVSSPRFWEQVDGGAVCKGVTVVPLDEMERGGKKLSEYTRQALEVRWGPFYREFSICLDAGWQKGDRVRLDFSFDKGSFSLLAEVTEQVVEW